ncbi:tetraspanin-18-like isoform X2 [Homalodisca vitripennis]|uniref:tetraspanin-18-like isoform X2 n=1 Tax=Homalodisca vitripennis TaxID=197043 RepID=UPI001EEA524C|nr:tetraspanin-18-like isoform X2 [Homalodisca vitripennis]
MDLKSSSSHRKRMSIFCSPNCSRGVVICFSFLFWVTGCLLIMLGFWVMLDPSKFHLLLLMTTENEAHYFVVALAYTFFLVGCGMFGLVFMGCCTIQTKASLIAAYLTITVLLECIELAAVLTVISCRSSMLVGLQSRLIENLMVNYGHQNNDNVNTHGNNVFTQSLDYTQYMLHCCGVTGAHDYNTSRWFNESTLSKEPRNVPITCCLRTELEENSVGSPISVVSRVFHGTVEEVWQNPRVQREMDCQNDKPGTRFNQGCLELVQDWFLSQSLAVILILLLPMVLQFACIAFFSSLLRKLCHQEVPAAPGSRHSSDGG